MKKITTLFSMVLLVLCMGLTSCDDVIAVSDNPSGPVKVTSVTLDAEEMTMEIGEVGQLKATVAPEDATDKTVTWTSSKESVATVDAEGKVTAVAEGTAKIKAKAGYVTATCTVTVLAAWNDNQPDNETPLTLKAMENGKITVTFNNGVVLKSDIHYTVNGRAEQTIAKDTEGAFDISVKEGDKVQFYSTNAALAGDAVSAARGGTRAVDTSAKYINIKPSMKTEIYGNVMSLVKGKDDFKTADKIEGNDAFYGLFAGAEKLVNSTERLLVLPATTLTEGCYQDMFNGCKGIEKAPELPAPKLEKNCYQEMFYDCSKLNHVKCLATDITAENSTKDWLGNAGTEATGAKVLESVVDMKANSDDGVPESWTPKKIVLVESVTLDKTELALTVGDDAVQLKATVLPEDAIDPTVTWTSSKPAVATVDATGKVTPVSEGEATITATAGDKTATCKVTVKAAVLVESVTLSSSELTLVVGEADVTLTATVKPEGTDITWTSSNPAVATVVATDKVKGLVHAVSAGEATITVTAGDKSATCKVTVIEKVGDVNGLDPFEGGGDPL